MYYQVYLSLWPPKIPKKPTQAHRATPGRGAGCRCVAALLSPGGSMSVVAAGVELSWSDAAIGSSGSLPRARGGAAGAQHRGEGFDTVYIFGGRSVMESFEEVQSYDNLAHAWRELQANRAPATARRGHTLNILGARLREQLVVWGGWRGDGPVSPALRSFDLQTHAWTVPASVGAPPAARWAHTATTINTWQMVVFGERLKTAMTPFCDTLVTRAAFPDLSHLQFFLHSSHLHFSPMCRTAACFHVSPPLSHFVARARC